MRTAVLIPFLLFGTALMPTGKTAAATFDDANYARLLSRHTREGTIGGVDCTAVDYGELARQAGDPKSLYRRTLDDFARFDPDTLGSDPERKAFWMNAYNLGAIRMLVSHWPVDSIRSRKISLLGLPWKKKILTVGGREYSLDEIERGILLDTFKDLRTHWAIVCASVSCPSLRREPLRAATLDAQLADQGRKFWNEPRKGARIDREKNVLHVTKIYEYFDEQFEKWGGGIGNVIAPYRERPEDRSWLKKGGYAIKAFDYDWSVNDVARLDRRAPAKRGPTNRGPGTRVR